MRKLFKSRFTLKIVDRWFCEHDQFHYCVIKVKKITRFFKPSLLFIHEKQTNLTGIQSHGIKVTGSIKNSYRDASSDAVDIPTIIIFRASLHYYNRIITLSREARYYRWISHILVSVVWTKWYTSQGDRALWLCFNWILRDLIVTHTNGIHKLNLQHIS